jgi:hypothetical protein
VDALPPKVIFLLLRRGSKACSCPCSRVWVIKYIQNKVNEKVVISSKDIIKKVGRQLTSEWETIFASHVSDKV